MKKSPALEVVRPSFGHLETVFADARRALVCTAFFSKEGLSKAENALTSAEKLELWLPLNVTHWVSGHADFGALADSLKRLREGKTAITVRVKSTIHAKLYYSKDKRRALLTSANLTGAGFGSNVEIGALLHGNTCDEIDRWVSSQRIRIPKISLEDLISCIDITKDAVSQTSSSLETSLPGESAEYNTVVDLFEKELVPRLSPPRRQLEKKERAGSLSPGAAITPARGDISKRLPKGWPSYEHFLDYVNELGTEEARELAERAGGKSNLQGHVKHFFWSSLIFLLENPRVINEVAPDLVNEKIVHWGDIEWVGLWRRFLERHDDEYYPDLAISFHTVKIYLPPTLGGTTMTGGAGSGNFKRTICLLAKYLRERQ